MTTPNYRKASIYFDDETVLEVEQRGGGGSGVGGDTGLSAVNLITGESTNEAIAEKDETIAEQAATIETQAGTIEEQAATIEAKDATIAEKDATIAEKDATITEQAGTIAEQEDEIAALEAQLANTPNILTQRLSYVAKNVVNSPDIDKLVVASSSGSGLTNGTTFVAYPDAFQNNNTTLVSRTLPPFYQVGSLPADGAGVASFLVPSDATVEMDPNYNQTGVTLRRFSAPGGYARWLVTFYNITPENSETRITITAAAAS